jgi:hypothetical protein
MKRNYFSKRGKTQWRNKERKKEKKIKPKKGST